MHRPVHLAGGVHGDLAQGRTKRTGHADVRHDRTIVECVLSPGGTVDVLVADHQVARPDLRLQAADRTGTHYARHAQRLEGIEVRPVVDSVRWQDVPAAVPGQESYRPPRHFPDAHDVAVRPIRRLDAQFPRAFQELVQTRTSDDADFDLCHAISHIDSNLLRANGEENSSPAGRLPVVSRIPRLPAVNAIRWPRRSGRRSASSRWRTAAGASPMRGRGNVMRTGAIRGKAAIRMGRGNGA